MPVRLRESAGRTLWLALVAGPTRPLHWMGVV